MEEMAQNDELSSSNKNTDEIINKIQTSLERLQTTINNRQIIDNITNTNNNQNKNVRKKLLDSKPHPFKKENPSLTESNISNLLNNNNYSMSNDNNSLFSTDKRFLQRKINQGRLLDKGNLNVAKKINRTTENIIPKSTPGRKDFYYNKDNYNYNYNTNRSRLIKRYNTTNKKCLRCGNINPPQSKFCFNCGDCLTNNNSNNIINQKPVINNSNEERITSQSQSQILLKSENNKPLNNKIMNNIYADLSEIQNEDLINYKKLNDLYLYGDYLENELKVSNDENLKLLEKYKTIKTQVHNLNQKKNKIKQNIELLNKKEKALDKINSELKNGFNFVQNKLGTNSNSEEKIKLLNDLELDNKKYIEVQKEYDLEIDRLKNRISLLADKEEENDEDDKVIKNLENTIEEEKKELEEKNMLYMLLIKKNELLNLEINNLAKELDLDLNEEDEGENPEEEEEINDDNNNNLEKQNNNNDVKAEENKIEENDEKIIKNSDKLKEEKNIENKDVNKNENEMKNDNNINDNINDNNEIVKENKKDDDTNENQDNNG